MDGPTPGPRRSLSTRRIMKMFKGRRIRMRLRRRFRRRLGGRLKRRDRRHNFDKT
jgi:hypothetical protein